MILFHFFHTVEEVFEVKEANLGIYSGIYLISILINDMYFLFLLFVKTHMTIMN